MRRRQTLFAALCLLALLTSCVKPNTFNPYNPPERSELDRLQKIINDRPDLEEVQQELAKLDSTIKATIARYSPATVFSQVPLTHPTNGCSDPFTHNIGRQVATDLFSGSPAPTREQWLEITSALKPVFEAAKFRPNNSAPGQPPQPVGASNYSQIRDDGARIELKNGTSAGDPGLLSYSYDTGCHLPAAWRTSPPPPNMRPTNDPDVHYPYLYGPPGGRTAEAQ